MHRYQDLITIFDQAFYREFNTRLIKGADEPIYLPATEQCDYHQIVFAHGFFASGLHEISHWCIAGERRRQLVDFGYWYEPDGRSADQQAVFETVEIKPQALEWALCVASNKPFNVSVDNLGGDVEPDALAFKRKVFEQVKHYLKQGFPARGQQFIESLAAFYQVDLPLCVNQFLTPFEQDKLYFNKEKEHVESCYAEV